MRRWMREARERLGLRMNEAAEQAGITTSYWSLIEAKKKTPSLEVAGRIAKLLGVPADVLFDELRLGA